MKKIKLTQGQVAFVDDIDYEYLSQWKWYANRMGNHFRVMRAIRVGGKRITCYMHTEIANRMKIDPKLIDHKDQNPLNNQRSNLRSATQSQNLHNCGAPKNNTSGVKGVTFIRARSKYRAQIEIHGKYHFVGYHSTLDEAATAVQKKRRELVGEFACA